MKWISRLLSKKTSGFSLVELLLVIMIIAVLAALVLPHFTPAAEAADGVIAASGPLGPFSTNITVTITNTGSVAANVSGSAVYVNPNTNASKRVRLIILPDATYNAFIGYGDTIYTNESGLYTNKLYLTGTSGHPLRAIANGTLSSGFVTQKPFLWRDAISITCTATLAASNGVSAVFKVIDEPQEGL